MNQPKSEELKWLGVDWDKTIFDNTGYPDFTPTKPMKGAIKALKKLVKLDYKIIIYTARSWGDYQIIEDCCAKYKIPFRRIICGKPLFKYVIDDKNIEFDGDWDKAIKKIKK